MPLKRLSKTRASQPAQKTHLENLWSVNVTTTRYQPKLITSHICLYSHRWVITLSGPSTLGSSHSLPLARPVLTPSLWLAPRPPVLTPYLWLAPRPAVLTPYLWLAPRPAVLTPYLWLAPRPPVLTFTLL